jgi:hypothetical protein
MNVPTVRKRRGRQMSTALPLRFSDRADMTKSCRETGWQANF